MRDPKELSEWARAHADALSAGMTWRASGGGYGGYWEANSTIVRQALVGRAIAGLEFLRRFAGADSEWSKRATALYENQGENQSFESGARAVGDILR